MKCVFTTNNIKNSLIYKKEKYKIQNVCNIDSVFLYSIDDSNLFVVDLLNNTP